MQLQPKFKVGDVVHFANGYGVYWGTWRVTGIEQIFYSSSGFGYYLEGSDTPWYANKEESLFPVGEESSAVFAAMVSTARDHYSDPDCVRIGCEDVQSNLVGRLTPTLLDALETAGLVTIF